MSSGDSPASPQDGASVGDAPKAWASGRTLSEAQRERKRQKDRVSKSKRRRDDQRLVENLKAKVDELTAKVAALEEKQTDQPAAAVAVAAAAATGTAATADTFPATAYPSTFSGAASQPVYYLEQTGPSATTGFVEELSDQAGATGSTDHTAPTRVLPLPHETAIATQTQAGTLQPDEPALVQDLFNHLLCMALVIDRSAICVDEALSADAIIRGILQGWDTVLSAPYVCPLWDILSRFDILIFAYTSVLTRFSTLKVLRHFMLYLSGLNTEAQMPAFMRPRPSQVHFRHVLAVDVLPWPGLRERAVLDPTVTRSNKFWREIIGLFELHWPYQPQEAFQVDPITNLYTFSALYENHHREISMWRMKTDFFRSFPAVFEDIVLFTHLYRQPSTRPIRAIPATPESNDPLDEDEQQLQPRPRRIVNLPTWPPVNAYAASFIGIG